MQNIYFWKIYQNKDGEDESENKGKVFFMYGINQPNECQINQSFANVHNSKTGPLATAKQDSCH